MGFFRFPTAGNPTLVPLRGTPLLGGNALAARHGGVRHVATEVPRGEVLTAGPVLPHALPGEPGHRQDGGGPV